MQVYYSSPAEFSSGRGGGSGYLPQQEDGTLSRHLLRGDAHGTVSRCQGAKVVGAGSREGL